VSTIYDTDANDPKLNIEEGDLPEQGVVRPDHNIELPEDLRDDLFAYPQIDNNAAAGVVLDLNATPPEDRVPDPPPPINEIDPPPDPESQWIGDRRNSDAIDLPHSRYQSPDLSFTDPSDHEEPYEAVAEQALTTRPRYREAL
jgi:hypothetical protein